MSLEEKAKELIIASGAVQSTEYQINKMLETMGAPNISTKEAEEIAEANIPAYVESLTEKEMDDALVWYRSESGKSLVEKNTSIMEKAQHTCQDVIKKILEERISNSVGAMFDSGEEN